MTVAKSFWTERRVGCLTPSRFAALRAGVTAFKHLRKGDLYAELQCDPGMEARNGAAYIALLDEDLERMLGEALKQVDPARAAALRARLAELDEEREDALLHLAQIEQARKNGGTP